MTAAYQRHLDDETDANIRRSRNLERRHVGIVGKRAVFCDLVIKQLRHFDFRCGSRTLVTFEDAAGNILIWWATRTLYDFVSGDEYNLVEGDLVDVRGTVKKHGDYGGTPQTELSQVQITKKPAILEMIGVPLPPEQGGSKHK